MANKVPAANGSALPAPGKPWGEMSRGERLERATDSSLDVVRQILEAPVDLDNVRFLAIQKETALTIISQQIRVDERRTWEGAEREARSNAALDRIEQELRDYEKKKLAQNGS